MIATPDNPSCERCDMIMKTHDLAAWPQIDMRRKYRCDGFRRRVEDMPRLGIAPHPDVPLGEYHHYKGSTYLVIGGCLDDDTQEVLVLYVSCEHGYVGPARTVRDFTEVVAWPDGVERPRFYRGNLP